MDLLKNVDDVDAQLIGAAFVHFPLAILKEGLEVLSEARHNDVGMLLLHFSLRIDRNDGA